ncbi:hypothetical protein MTP99_000129 [Tenebrio molitor]|jgi:hypothetical protein|nr:hypothetical protein MTP99_000129 [Tenebrio molitor]
MSIPSLHLFLLLLVPLTFCQDNTADYYWREYTGVIPRDAVKGGANINGEQVYIAQAYVKNHGLIPGQINAGVKEVWVPIDGVQKIDQHIKILCSVNNFVWVATNSTNLHVEMVDRQMVIGGHEDDHGIIAVGRISYEGGTQIGKIDAFTVGDSHFRWVDSNKNEGDVTSFDVLVYQRW